MPVALFQTGFLLSESSLHFPHRPSCESPIMPNPLYRQNILSVSDLSIEQLQCLLDTALRLKRQPRGDLLEGRLIAS